MFLTEEQDKEIVKLYTKENKDAKAISKIIGPHQTTILSHLRKQGIKIRRERFKPDKETISKIIELYTKDKIPIHKLTKQFNTNITKITNILKDNKVELWYEQKRYNIKPEQITEMIEMYNKGMSTLEIGRKTGIGYKTITEYIIDDPRTKYRVDNRILVNDNAFSGVLSEDGEYWCGVMMSDGSVLSNKNMIELGFEKSDEKHINKFKSFLKFEGKTYYKKGDRSGNYKICGIKCKTNDFAYVHITSKQLKKDLIKYGVVPLKTYCAEALNGIENSIHFWRGCVDGDGWISIDKNKKIGVGLTGTKRICEQLDCFVIKNLGGKSSVIRQKNKNNESWSISYSGEKAYGIIELLYKKSKTYLDRKYNKYLEAKRIMEKNKI